jgi:virginiamycin B lyase
MKSFSLLRALAAVAVVPMLVSSDVAAQATPAHGVTFKEWNVPFGGRPRDPFVDPTNSNRVWFVGQQGHYLAYLDATSGEFKRFDLNPGAGPHNCIVAADGTVWYSGNGAQGGRHIGKLNPATGEITRYPMPDSTVRDPHTLVFDSKGDIWFTAQGSQVVGKLTVSTGKVDIIRLPMFGQRVNPYGIVLDKAGKVWFNAFATNKTGMVDPVTMQPKAFDLPEGARGRRIAVTSDQMIWHVDYARGQLGRLNPNTGEVKEWLTPGGAGSQPYAMAVDEKDRLWFVESMPRNANQLVGFDPKTEKFFSVAPMPAQGAGTVRHMVYHPGDRVIWMGTDTGFIVRAAIPQ